MSKSTQPKAAATPGALPTFHHVIALAITKADSDLRKIAGMRVSDEHWDDADVYVDFAIELALTHIECMKTMTFEEDGEFSYEWFKVAGAVNLGRAVFSRKDCAYFRMLEGACEMFDQLAELVEFSEKVA